MKTVPDGCQDVGVPQDCVDGDVRKPKGLPRQN
jgi:hypothetical protein